MHTLALLAVFTAIVAALAVAIDDHHQQCTSNAAHAAECKRARLAAHCAALVDLDRLERQHGTSDPALLPAPVAIRAIRLRHRLRIASLGQ